LRRAPRTWWLWGALVTIAFAIFAVAIAPVYLEPVFNKFQPLSEGPLKQQILATARANEIPATDVYQFDASKQTKRMSAHVSGPLAQDRHKHKQPPPPRGLAGGIPRRAGPGGGELRAAPRHKGDPQDRLHRRHGLPLPALVFRGAEDEPRRALGDPWHRRPR